MKKYLEEKCGRVVFERVVDNQEEIQLLENSGHLLSCGGIYISRINPEPPHPTRYDVLNLPDPHRAPLILKDLEILAADQTRAFEELFGDNEEVREPSPVAPVKKVYKEHLN